MSSKRKTSSLSQSSASGSELSDAGRELELLASKKHKQSYAYSRWGFSSDVVRSFFASFGIIFDR